MPAYYKQADVMLLTLKKSICPHLNATIPARVQSYMSAGKPIVGMAGHGVRTLINNHGCGLIADSGDYIALTNNILYLYNNRHEAMEMGHKARILYEQQYTLTLCMNKLERIINNQ